MPRQFFVFIALLFLLPVTARSQVSYPRGSMVSPTTVALLPLIGNSNLLYDVRDGNPNCSTGGGSARVVCRWNGATYSTLSTAAAPSGSITSSGYTMNTARLLGRNTASAGAIEEITLGTNLSFSGTTLNATGGATINATDGTLPKRSSSSAFTDSLISEASSNIKLGLTELSGRLQFGGTTSSFAALRFFGPRIDFVLADNSDFANIVLGNFTSNGGGSNTLTGPLIWNSDNGVDVGANGASRPRTGYFGTSVIAPTVNATTSYQVNGTTIYSSGTPGIAGNGTLNTGSKDSAGKVTATGTGASTIVLTFSITFTRAPACMVTNETTANLVRPISTTTTLTVAATIVSGDSISYTCTGY